MTVAPHSQNMVFFLLASANSHTYFTFTSGGLTVRLSVRPASVLRTKGPECEPTAQCCVAKPMYCMPAGTASGIALVIAQLATPLQPVSTFENFATPVLVRTTTKLTMYE